MRILVTGAGGLVGHALMEGLDDADVIATDLTAVGLPTGVTYRKLDVTTDAVDQVFGEVQPEVVVHLASIVTPPSGMTRQQAHAVDVEGTRRIIEACLKHQVRRLVVTSSGAAYGYHADNPVPLRETDPCRGNTEFAYSDHKRQVEEMLAQARIAWPELEQVVLRVGTVLGEGTDNQITALFRKPRLLAVTGSESPFVFIGLPDLAQILARAATTGPTGVYNVAGDGALGVTELAAILGKPVRRLPAWLLRLALRVAGPLGLSRYGPEQVRFLQYRPVLDNSALKDRFGYTPRHSSREVFEAWVRSL